MSVVLALLAGAVGTTLGAPLALRRAGWNAGRPARALCLWCAAYAVGMLAAVASLAVALSIALSRYRPDPADRPTGLAATEVVIFCWVALVGVGALMSLVVTRSEPLTTDHRRSALLMTMLARSSAYRREALGRVTVLYVQSDRPVAISLPGRNPRVVVTSRLERELPPGQLRAVIEHERAHLVRHHGRIVQLAQLNAACLPALPGARDFSRAARLLVELVADDAAARACGREDLVKALTTLAALTGDEGLLLRARRAETIAPRRPGAAALVGLLTARALPGSLRSARDGDG